MVTPDLYEDSLTGTVSLRNEPVQARSTARLAALLDAAAGVVGEIGYERLTTAMVAERAGASIGTVYRYFPDRIALLRALGARNLERVFTSMTDEVASEFHKDWSSALNASFDILVKAFKNEPGFRALRVGDVIDLRPAPRDKTYNSTISDALFALLVTRFDLPNTESGRFAVETAFEVTDALAARAFARSSRGDAAFIKAAQEIANSLLVAQFGEPGTA